MGRESGPGWAARPAPRGDQGERGRGSRSRCARRATDRNEPVSSDSPPTLASGCPPSSLDSLLRPNRCPSPARRAPSQVAGHGRGAVDLVLGRPEPAAAGYRPEPIPLVRSLYRDRAVLTAGARAQDRPNARRTSEFSGPGARTRVPRTICWDVGRHRSDPAVDHRRRSGAGLIAGRGGPSWSSGAPRRTRDAKPKPGPTVPAAPPIIAPISGASRGATLAIDGKPPLRSSARARRLLPPGHQRTPRHTGRRRRRDDRRALEPPPSAKRDVPPGRRPARVTTSGWSRVRGVAVDRGRSFDSRHAARSPGRVLWPSEVHAAAAFRTGHPLTWRRRTRSSTHYIAVDEGPAEPRFRVRWPGSTPASSPEFPARSRFALLPSGADQGFPAFSTYTPSDGAGPTRGPAPHPSARGELLVVGTRDLGTVGSGTRGCPAWSASTRSS